MTNFEYYKDDILSILGTGDQVAIDKKDNKPVHCNICNCNNCILNLPTGGCNDLVLFAWLYSEHAEEPKINKRTKMFFEAIKTGWVARNPEGSISIYTEHPVKIDGTYDRYWINPSQGRSASLSDNVYPFLTLDFIKWEDAEPWRVEDILKLEVLEEE